MATKNLQYSPKRRLRFEKFNSSEEEAKCLRSISEHYFNFSVGLVVPTLSKQKICESIPTSSVFTDFCCLADMALTDFINPEFIQNFVRKGSVIALSYKTNVDTSDCIALLPTGILHLSLTKDTYECLGLQGKPSPFNKNLRFDIEVNLLAPYFQPSKKYYERVKKSFQRTPMKLKFLLSTNFIEATDQTPTPDLCTYLQSCGIAYQPFSCETKVEEFLNVDIPLVLCNQSLTESTIENECTGLLFHEWLGCIACGIDCSDAAADSFVNTLCCPKPNQKTHIVLCRWTGFLQSKCIQDLVQKARGMLKENPEIPWLSVLVWGFSDSPVSWRNRRHGYYISGDNDYTLVLFQNDEAWMYRMLGDNDEQS